MREFGWLIAWAVFCALLMVSVVVEYDPHADLEDRMDTIRAERSQGRFER